MRKDGIENYREAVSYILP